MTCPRFCLGGSAIAAIDRDGRVALFSADAGALRRRQELHSGRTAHRLAVPTDGTKLAVLDGANSIHVFEALTGAPLCELAISIGPVLRMCFVPSSSQLAIACRCGDGTRVTLWDMEPEPDPVWVLNAGAGGIRSMECSDELVWVLTTEGYLRVWSHEGETVLVTSFGPKADMAYPSTDGSRVAIVCGKVFGTYSGRDPRRGRPIETHGDCVTAMCHSPDGRALASGSANGEVHLYDTLKIGMRAGAAR